MRSHVLLTASLLLGGCASTSPPPAPPPALEGVEITLEQRGALLDPGGLRLVETGEPDRPLPAGSDYWLRLSNRSPFLLALHTQSMYISQPPELTPIGQNRSVFAVEDGGRLVLLFEGYDGRYGFGDFSGVSYLPSGRSVLFQVPERYLRKDREIHVDFLAYTKEGGEAERAHRASFRADRR